MMFMACSLELFGDISVMPGLVQGIHVFLFISAKERTWMAGTSPAMTQQNSLNPRHIELRLLAGTIALERAGLADRIGALKNPILPRGEAREDFRFHGLRADEAQVRFHAGQAVGRERGALLEEHPDLVIPVDIVKREGDEAEAFGRLGIERLADLFPRAVQIHR